MSIHYVTAERMQGRGHLKRVQTYRKALSAFTNGTSYAQETIERVENPYGDGQSFAGWLTQTA